WRIVAAGSTYIAHTVGAGKSFALAGAIMEQMRPGLISKAMPVVPGHCLARSLPCTGHCLARSRASSSSYIRRHAFWSPTETVPNIGGNKTSRPPRPSCGQPFAGAGDPFTPRFETVSAPVSKGDGANARG
ncbi:MAG TPA: hypothetical protein VMU81_08135, partial [Acetobacteraceae bacterium]|nr:hypothetical protein [Acetobacteraceae bacterium]